MSNVATSFQLNTTNSANDSSTARAEVQAAIAAANYANVGAPFSPMLLKFANQGDLSNIWTSNRGDTAISFYQFNGNRSDGFLPLGDYAVVGQNALSKTPVMLLAPIPGNESALAHPTGFQWIADDHGSGNDNDIAYFWPTAPDGYQALGICFGSNGAQPVAANYWCVSTAYLQNAGVSSYWSDSGQHWTSHNGSLSVPSLTDVGISDSLLLAPTTLLSDEFTGNNGGVTNSWCLVLSKLFLPVSGSGVPYPDYQPQYGQGTQTDQGIQSVAVLPYNVANDPNAGGTPQSTPFYYLAGQPYWVCTTGFPSPSGGSYTTSFTVGTSQEQSSGFQNTTSITVGADVGIEAGGASAHMSVSYTDEMQISGSTTTGSSTEVSQSLTLNLPVAAHVLLWQKAVNFVSYRTDGTSLSQATYQTTEIDFTDSNPA